MTPHIQFTIPDLLQFPVVLSVPHAGIYIPTEVKNSFCTQDRLVLNRDADLFVDELYFQVQDLPVAFLSTTINRYVIDCNRNAQEVNGTFLSGVPLQKTSRHLSLVAHQTTQNEPLLTRLLSLDDLNFRIKNYYTPFHDTLKKMTEALYQHFGFYINFEAHSMPSVPTKNHEDFGQSRADIVLGTKDGTSCTPEITAFIRNGFESHGLSVAENIPYKGGYVTEVYGQPQKNRHSLLVEINRKLYMNESTQTESENFKKMQKICFDVVSKLALWSVNQFRARN